MDENNSFSFDNSDVDKIKLYLQSQSSPESLEAFIQKAYKSIAKFKVPNLPINLTDQISLPKDHIDMHGYSIETISPTILKFAFPVRLSDTEASYNIYVNHSEDIPAGKIVWDYFGSGECYCNLNLVNLQFAKNEFSKLYTSYMIVPTRLGTQPTEVGVSPFNFVTSATAPSGNLAWSFDLATLFVFSKKAVDFPVCVYFTHKNADTNIVSKHFKFANVPNNTCSCSHPTMSVDKNKFSSCHYSMSNNECPLYTDDSRVVFSQDVNPINTTSVVSFDMSYAITTSGSHLFNIRNTTDKILINSLKYPSDVSYDSCLEEALRIFNEYTSVYSFDSSITEVKRELTSDTDKDIAKSSYIESLITA